MDDFIATYWIVSLIVSVIMGIIFGAITKTINGNKGYEGGFGWGFFLGVIGIIVVACKPDCNTHAAPSYNTAYLQDMIRQEVKKEVQRVLAEERAKLENPQLDTEDADQSNSDPKNVVTQPIASLEHPNMIICPKCGCEQKASRTMCWRCGVKFV